MSDMTPGRAMHARFHAAWLPGMPQEQVDYEWANCLPEAKTAWEAVAQPAEPQPAPELQITDCEAHDGASHLQINTRGRWLCVVSLAPILAEYEPQPADEPQPAPEEVAGEIVYLYHWRFDRGEEFGLYRHAADADARAAQHADEGLSEVLSMAVLGRPEQPAPELAAATAETRKVADAANVILDAFGKASDGYRARLSGVTLTRAYKAIGRPVPDYLRHLEGQ